MDTDRRLLQRVMMEDEAAVGELFAKLMGDKVEPRRAFIEDNARSVRFLDVEGPNHEVARPPAGCKPARFGALVNAECTEHGPWPRPPNHLVLLGILGRPSVRGLDPRHRIGRETDGYRPSRCIEPRELDREMSSSYLDYAMSVIVGRALPDVRDGLKPFHRRVVSP